MQEVFTGTGTTVPVSFLYGLAGLLDCTILVLNSSDGKQLRYKRSKAWNVPKVVIVGDNGLFYATVRCDSLPVCPVPPLALMPYVPQGPSLPPVEPVWHFSSAGFKDWDAHPEDLQTHLYGAEGDLKVATLNVNCLSPHKFGGVLWWMGRHGVDIMCLQDTRVRQRDGKIYKQWAREALGAQVKCFVDGGVNGEGPMAIGGQMIIVGQLWGAKC